MNFRSSSLQDIELSSNDNARGSYIGGSRSNSRAICIHKT